MKKLFFAVVLSVLSLTANAQDFKNEVYMNNSLMSLSTFNNGNGFKKLTMNMWSVGYNRTIELSEQMPLQMTVGAKFMYGRVKDGEFGLTDSRYDSDDEMIRLTVPANLKMVFPLVGKFAAEPYVGLNASINSNDTGFGGNKLNLGWQCGMDFSINRFVVGVSYTNDFFKYRDVEIDSKAKSAYWSSVDFKLGYRF